MRYYESRRHRLNENETPLILNLIKITLKDLLYLKEDILFAEELWRILYRFETYKHGRPSYPDFSWELLDAWLSGERGFVNSNEVAFQDFEVR